MTEAEWLACTDPEKMLAFLESSPSPSDRRFHLLAVACDRYLPFLTDLRDAFRVCWDVRPAMARAFLRDIFGNPFRPVSLDSAWRTSTAVGLATAAYEERILPAGTLDRDRLAVLADALEGAGCDSADILSHLRGLGPHVRGCWVRFVDYQYRQIGAGDSSSRGQAESVRQLTNRADAISAEGGSLLKHGPTRRGLTTPARECKGPEGGSVEPDRRYPV